MKSSKILLPLVLSCATQMRVDYSRMQDSQRASSMYENISTVLQDLCNKQDFMISPEEFHCTQRTPDSITTHFRWKDISSISCEGRFVKISDSFDEGSIYTDGPTWQRETKQCVYLAKVMNMYLQERRK